MRVLPYFNNIRPAPAGNRPSPVMAPVSGQADNSPAQHVSRSQAPGADVFIPSSPVSGVVYSYHAPKADRDTPDSVIKSGNYSFYQLNGSKQSNEPGEVGGKLDLKG
ncbi:MAG: hypothetical protein FVQ81_00545 [Candidatus Glassbacteria bacterium]|nr:hypothetical protein [Candidatus Glassbacteria bacterium]